MLFRNDNNIVNDVLRVLAARFRRTAVVDYLCLAFALIAEGRFSFGLPLDYLEEPKKKQEEKAIYK